MSAFFKLCEENNDMESKEVFVGLLRQSRSLENKAYASLIGLRPSECQSLKTISTGIQLIN